MNNRPASLAEARSALGEDAVLLDASTVAFLADHKRFSALTGNYFADSSIAKHLVGALQNHAAGREVPENLKSDLDALVTVLGFLELWVLHDNLVVDKSALQSIERDRNSDKVWDIANDLLKVIPLPSSVVQPAAKNAAKYSCYLKRSNDSIFSYGAVHGVLDYDADLKDGYFSNLSAYLGVSANSPERMLFYLEASRLLEVPLLIHPRKAEYLKKFGQSISLQRREAYRKLARGVEKTLGYKEREVPVPPLADEIVRVAMEEKCPLKTAARHVKRDSKVRSLVKLIRRLSDPALSVPYRRQTAAEAVRRIAKSVEWRVYPGGCLSRRRINLGRIESIGPVLSVIGAEEIVVPNVVLSEPGYNIIFSKWANSALRALGSV